MCTDDIELSGAASEYIERRPAFWLMENASPLEPQDIVEETLNPCIEALSRKWTEFIQDAVETVNEKLGFNVQLRISVAKFREDLAFLQETEKQQQSCPTNAAALRETPNTIATPPVPSA